jgi:uncharacterized protein
MLPIVSVSKKQAKRFLLSHQKLLPSKKLVGKEGVLSIIDHLGCIQYDTINSVGRNADLVLQARIKNYHPSLIKELLYQDRKLIDGWDKMASIFRIEDWPYFSRTRVRFGEYYTNRSEKVAPYIPKVIRMLKEMGPLSSIDIKEDFGKIDWFWGNKTSVGRAALEILHYQGDIGVHGKIGTRRIFDLIENLIPATILNAPIPYPIDEDYHEWHYLRRLSSLGLGMDHSGVQWSGIRKDGSKATNRKKVLKRLLEKNLITEVKIEGIEKPAIYIRTQDIPHLTEDAKNNFSNPTVSFIAPLDNLIWDRDLIEKLFDFKYRWEVYHPVVKRKYGYYVLPVLYKDKLVARIDLNYDRKSKTLGLTNFWWQAGQKTTATFEKAFKSCLRQFSKTLDCKAIDWESFNRIFS